MRRFPKLLSRAFPALIALGLSALAAAAPAPAAQNSSLAISVAGGKLILRLPPIQPPVLRAGLAVKINGRWIRGGAYPHRQTSTAGFHDELGAGRELVTRFSGLAGAPELKRVVRVYAGRQFAVMLVAAHNTGRRPLRLEAFRLLASAAVPHLAAGAGADTRVLAGSYSEDPAMHIVSLARAPRRGFLGVDDLLLYNRRRRLGLLLAALSQQRFLTILRLHPQAVASDAPGLALTVDSTGTTAAVVQRDQIPAAQQLPLELTLAPGARLQSETLMLTGGPDAVRLLARYGRAVRQLRHPRFLRPAPMGWWSWTAFYGGIDAGEVQTNAAWLSQHLRRLGFDYFHIDEGYQYARGEYTTANATQFPRGMRRLEYRIHGLGLTPAIWTAPFEISERARVFARHPDWLVKDAHGRPIRIGYVTSHQDALYVLDTTSPGAQAWLYRTYRRMARVWGIRAFKLDFMDSAAVEGHYFRPNTTALEAQRLGLEILRRAVGPNVLLDKDGSPMLNPIGLVQAGRISVDTGHSFRATRTAAWNIAARFYMNRDFYTSDPDAFSVTRQLEPQEHWHQSKTGLTYRESEAQIVLAALAGGMYEIGDDLPTLGSEPRRLALVKNRELIALNRLGRAARPLDLMTFRRRDGQPSEFFLRQDRRQAMLAVFNFTGQPRTHSFALSQLGFARAAAPAAVRAFDVLDRDRPVALSGGTLRIESQPPRSVRLIKLVNTAIRPRAPQMIFSLPRAARAGEPVTFVAELEHGSTPAPRGCRWSFGDGTRSHAEIVESTGGLKSCRVRHTYTLAGNFHAVLVVPGLDGPALRKSFMVRVTGYPTTRFELEKNRRYHSQTH